MKQISILLVLAVVSLAGCLPSTVPQGSPQVTVGLNIRFLNPDPTYEYVQVMISNESGGVLVSETIKYDANRPDMSRSYQLMTGGKRVFLVNVLDKEQSRQTQTAAIDHLSGPQTVEVVFE